MERITKRQFVRNYFDTLWKSFLALLNDEKLFQSAVRTFQESHLSSYVPNKHRLSAHVAGLFFEEAEEYQVTKFEYLLQLMAFLTRHYQKVSERREEFNLFLSKVWDELEERGIVTQS